MCVPCCVPVDTNCSTYHFLYWFSSKASTSTRVLRVLFSLKEQLRQVGEGKREGAEIGEGEERGRGQEWEEWKEFCFYIYVIPQVCWHGNQSLAPLCGKHAEQLLLRHSTCLVCMRDLLIAPVVAPYHCFPSVFLRGPCSPTKTKRSLVGALNVLLLDLVQ